MRSWGSSQTSALIIFMLLFASCMLVVNSSIQNQMRQIVKESSSAIDQAKSILANATNNLLHPPTTTKSEAGGGGDDENDDEAFLAAHNKVRLHAREPPFTWDPKLASYARQFAQKRSVDCKLIHSDGPYGENIFWGGGNQWKAVDAVGLWVREHRFYDKETMKCGVGKMCGHYTQVVWRDSVRLGCARVQCACGDTFAVCSYDPPGNYIGENPFNVNNDNNNVQ